MWEDQGLLKPLVQNLFSSAEGVSNTCMKLITIVLYVPKPNLKLWSDACSCCACLFSFDLCLLYLALTVGSDIPKPNSTLAGSSAWFQACPSAFQLFFKITITIYLFILFHFMTWSQIYQEPQTVSEGWMEGNWAKQGSCQLSYPCCVEGSAGLHCYSKTTRLVVSKGEQDLRQNLLSLCFSHLWWLLVQLWA